MVHFRCKNGRRFGERHENHLPAAQTLDQCLDCLGSKNVSNPPSNLWTFEFEIGMVWFLRPRMLKHAKFQSFIFNRTYDYMIVCFA